MTPDILLTLGIIVVVVVLFATEKLRVDVIAMLVLLTVAFTGLVSPTEAFSGFSSPATITVWAVYIVSGGLFRTGVADMLGARISRLAGTSEPRLIAVVMLASGVMSSFMNNIGAVAVLLPAVVGISRHTKVPLSRLLIPLSFASLMGGNMTLIGTPPNILAASMLAERGFETFSFFDFTPMGVLVFASGIIYMVVIGRRLLPARQTAEERQTQRLREYVSEVRLLPDSPLVGKSLAASRLGSDFDLSVLAILREGRLQQSLNRDTRLEADDMLFVEGDAATLLSARQKLGLAIEAEPELALESLGTDDFHLVEATLAPRSKIAGQSLREMRFRDSYGYTALAIGRHGEVLTQHLIDVSLRFGDTLLLKGPAYRLPALQDSNDFLVLEPVTMELRRRNKAWISVAIMAMVLLMATVFKVPISLAMVTGAVAMVLSGCLTMDEAYQSIEWRSIFLIAGMLPLGLAMENTGTARFLADQVVGVLGPYGPLAVLAGIYILASLITEPMSNAAATVLIVPIAIDVALGLGAAPQPFVLATVIGASTSFLTPVGHQANVLVFGPGGYRFLDYTRVGWLLNLVIFAVTMIFLPLLWPLFP
jgi:di/tricarboxylate transporter